MAAEEPRRIARYIDQVRELLEVCSDKLLHAVAWYFTAFNCSDLSQATDAWKRSITHARAAYEAPGLGPEFGIVADRDFVLSMSLASYAVT